MDGSFHPLLRQPSHGQKRDGYLFLFETAISKPITVNTTLSISYVLIDPSLSVDFYLDR